MQSTKLFLALVVAAVASVFVGSAFIVSPSSGLALPEQSQRSSEGGSRRLEDGVASTDLQMSFRLCGAGALLLSTAFLLGRSSLAGKGGLQAGLKQEKRVVSVAAFENELGVQAPVGFWDPLGFTADGNVASFKRRRCCELKHGRICMMATMGFIQPETTGKWPGFLSPSGGLKFADIPNGLAAISKVPALGWAQIVVYGGFVEFSGGFEDYKSGTPGDYGWKVITSGDMTERTKKLAAEIANGRLAMMAIMGMFFQDGLTGSAWGDWALYTGSPLRAV